MARLGKREREAKRDIIQGNLKAPVERDYFNYRSPLDTDKLLARTHTNAYGASGGWGRMSGAPKGVTKGLSAEARARTEAARKGGCIV